MDCGDCECTFDNPHKRCKCNCHEQAKTKCGHCGKSVIDHGKIMFVFCLAYLSKEILEYRSKMENIQN